jgi:hypothetical protein
MSNINPQSIDGTYPIAGQDNNSQGFRDNFTNTVNNFTFAAAELTDLQQNAVLKAALGSAGQTGTPTNDLNYAYLTHPQIKGAVETKNAIGNVASGSFTVDWSTGHFQTVELTGTTATLSTFSNWPATNLFTKLRLQVDTYASICALTLPAAVSTNLSSIQGASGQVVTLPAGSVYQFEFSTWDGGATVAIQDLLRNYDAPIDFTNLVVSGYSSIAGNLLAGLSSFAAINNTPIGNATPSTGAFSNLSATGTTTFGNLSYSGTQVETGYQQIKPTTANVANVSISPTVNRVLIHPTNILSAFGGSFGANLTLPNTQVDGTIISISSNVTMASLSVITPWVGTSVSPAANAASVAPGTVSRFMFINADKTWYKIA